MSFDSMILSLILFTPIIGGVLIYIFGKQEKVKLLALLASVIPLCLSLLMLFNYKLGYSDLQFVKHPLITDLGITYFLGVDGLSMPLVLLTTLLSFLTILFSWDVKHKLREYFTFIISRNRFDRCICKLKFFLFYLFWELVLVPMYFLIIEWEDPEEDMQD